MKATISRRRLILGTAIYTVSLAVPAFSANPIRNKFEQLEDTVGGHLGVWAFDTGTGRRLSYRGDERVVMCSTFKIMLVGAILQHSQARPALLERHIAYNVDQLVSNSPIAQRQVDEGMTVAELCAASLQYSDNTAANLLLEIIGGPPALTAYARSVGDLTFHLDRYEPALNSALPGDLRDTTTPQAMGTSLQHLALGNGLDPLARMRLQNWLKGNTTGETRIRAAVPAGWVVGDKTGSGEFGVANDIGVIWPPDRAPWVLAIYTRGREKAAPLRSDSIAAATRIVVEAWAS
jgi:beta-lactamase class A